jgi:hypothetical protein
MASEYTPFSEIIIELKKLCDTKTTGTLFIATKKNRAAQVMIENGEIVFIYFAGKRGQKALSLMSEIQAGTFRFQAGKVISKRLPLPDTNAILQIFAGVVGQENLETKLAQSVPAAANSLNDTQKTILKECLAEYIGPMASIVCEDYFHSALDFMTIVDILATKISSVEQRDEFKERVMARIE